MSSLVEELNTAAVTCARKAIDRDYKQGGKGHKYIAGSVGPTNKTASLSPDARACTVDQKVSGSEKL